MIRLNVLALNLLALFCSIVINACKSQPSGQIKGHVELHPDWKEVIYLIKPRHFTEIAANYLGQVVDSTEIAGDGTFAFQPITLTQNKILLEFVVQKKQSRFTNQLIDSIPTEANYMPFVISNGNPVIIEASISSFQKSIVFLDPSRENSTLISLRDIRSTAFQKYLTEIGKETQADSMLIEHQKSYNDYLKPMMTFADTTTCIEAAMVSLRWISPTGDYERMPEFLHHQCQKWIHDHPDHMFARQLCTTANKNSLPVMTGDTMPDFYLPLVSGDTVRLNKLLGQKLTIVDIWASWCAPCRRENRLILTPLWSAYQSRGLQIIGYSIDNNETSWKSAIIKDGVAWVQASHLTGDDTPFLQALRITTIPANFVLDADGKIIAKNLNGEDLIEFVRSQLD
jgi:thiol-disulfide isomerase/thioredoxin